MKFYIASRFEMKDLILETYEQIKKLGHEIIYDWTIHKPIKPYEKNPETAREYATEDAYGAMNCDIFIMYSDKYGTGMYTEQGLAIASNLIRGKPMIYVIGENNSKSLFHFHPSVKRMNTLDEVLEDISKKN